MRVPVAPAALALSALLVAASSAAPQAEPVPPPRSGAAGEPAPGPAADADLATRLSGIQEALDRIATLMADSLDQQLVNVLMRRIELKARSLEPLEQALRDARSERDGLAQEHKRLESTLELMGGLEPGPPPPADEPRLLDLARGRQELERMAERIATLDRRIYEMESDLDQRRADIRDLEEMVDERIGLR